MVPHLTRKSNVNAKDLCEYDDLCLFHILDPFLGFSTRKMNIRYVKSCIIMGVGEGGVIQPKIMFIYFFS